TAISQIEGVHVTLKKYLQVLTSDLQTVYKRISLLLENQYNKIKAMISKDEIRLLCTHIIQEHLATNQVLSIDDVYYHWWIEGLKLPLQ
ncbi:28096_t:CDS:2, partial [Gigaspora margarita]